MQLCVVFVTTLLFVEEIGWGKNSDVKAAEPKPRMCSSQGPSVNLPCSTEIKLSPIF